MVVDPQNSVNQPPVLDYRGAPPQPPFARADGQRPAWGYVNGAFEMRGDVFLLLLLSGFGSILIVAAAVLLSL
jgi:hypothetical protein